MTDPIADLLARIRNAGLRKIEIVEVPHSKVKEQIVDILSDENLINGYDILQDDVTGFKSIQIKLRYTPKGQFVIQNLKRISKPGIRTYVGYQKMPKVLGGIGICIVSTSKGIMTGQSAKEQKIGGELLCTIY